MSPLNLPDKIINNTIKDDLLNWYSTNTLIRSFIQAIPFGAVVDNMLTVSYNNILVERAKTFYDELDKGEILLNEEIIRNEDFLHAYFATFKAAIYTKQREKIRFFARLLKSSFEEKGFSEADEYDDYLKILDELSFREIFMLYTLKTYEDSVELSDSPKDEDENDELRIASRYWTSFYKEINRAISISYSEFKGLISRLVRTGCYSPITSMTPGYEGDVGKTTEVFAKLIKFIELNGDDFVYFRKKFMHRVHKQF